MIKEEGLFTEEQKKEIIDLIVCTYEEIKRKERQQQEYLVYLKRLDRLNKVIDDYKSSLEMPKLLVRKSITRKG